MSAKEKDIEKKESLEEEKVEQGETTEQVEQVEATAETNETEELKAKADELNDKYLRLYSEFDNFRRRTIKEKADLSKRAGTEIVESIIPVLDDFERAMATMESADDVKSVKEGVELIYHKLKNSLHAKGLQPMESAKGQDFDDELHEAITNIPAPSEDLKGKVVDEIERGYYLNGIVLRYAKVIVGS